MDCIELWYQNFCPTFGLLVTNIEIEYQQWSIIKYDKIINNKWSWNEYKNIKIQFENIVIYKIHIRYETNSIGIDFVSRRRNKERV